MPILVKACVFKSFGGIAISKVKIAIQDNTGPPIAFIVVDSAIPPLVPTIDRSLKICSLEGWAGFTGFLHGISALTVLEDWVCCRSIMVLATVVSSFVVKIWWSGVIATLLRVEGPIDICSCNVIVRSSRMQENEKG